MTEIDDAKSAPNATSTNHEKNISSNVSNLLEIKLSLIVDVPKDEKKNLNKAERCGEIVYNFLRRIGGVTLPPGKFETPYDFSLDFKDIISSEGFIVKAALESSSSEFEANGLTCRYENDKLSIIGTPENPEGFDGKIRVTIKGKFGDVKTFEKTNVFPVEYSFPVESSFTRAFDKKIVLNPDPDSLWEDKPTPDAAPFKKDNTDVKSGTTTTEPSLNILGASQRGRSHAQIGSFRDDHFLIRLGENPDDWNFIAVADGAGSARFSREGSKIACEACINDPRTGLATLFKTHCETLNCEIVSIVDGLTNTSDVDFSFKLPQTNLQKLFFYSVRYAGEAIVNASKQVNAKLSDFNTTFLCTAFKRLPETEQVSARWIVLSYWVGDGGLAIFRPNGKGDVLALGTPDGGEFAGQTRFLTMKSELEEKSICGRLRLAVVEDFQALVLATDGITDPFFPAEANLSDYVYWKKFWNETLPKEFPGALDASKTLEERGQALLGGLKFKSKGNHDDRTLVLVLNDAFEQRHKIKDETSVTDQKADSEESCDITDNGNTEVVETTDEGVKVATSSEEPERSDSFTETEIAENAEPDTCVSDVSITECSNSRGETNSAENAELSVSQEKEEPANINSTCDTANDVETSSSVNVLEKDVALENNAEVTDVEISSSETPTEELPPPPDEIVLSVQKSVDEEALPDFVPAN